MKNVTKFLGIIALAAIIGFGIIACDEGNGNGNDAKSQLTINNIPADFNNKFIWAYSQEKVGEHYLAAVADSRTAGSSLGANQPFAKQISGGTAVLKVWKVDDENNTILSLYDGTASNIEFTIEVHSGAEVDEGTIIGGLWPVSISFTNGVATFNGSDITDEL